MMNKSSSKLIAWLLAMVMIFNIVPVTAFADYSNIENPQKQGDVSNIEVTYIADNGVLSGEAKRTGDKKTPTLSEYTYNDSNRRLAGWSTVQNYDGTNGYLFLAGSYVDFSKAYPTNQKLTLYAARKFAVTFGTNGGTWDGDTTVFVIPGEKVDEPSEIPEASWGDFSGWKYNGSAYNFNSPVTSDINLSASYDNPKTTGGDNAQGGGQNQVIGSEPFKVKYAIKASNNDFGTEDIPLTYNNGDSFRTVTASGTIQQYIDNNIKNHIKEQLDRPNQKLTDDQNPEDCSWNEEERILTADTGGMLRSDAVT